MLCVCFVKSGWKLSENRLPEYFSFSISEGADALLFAESLKKILAKQNELCYNKVKCCFLSAQADEESR